MTYKLTLDGTELTSFKITFNVGDTEKNGTYIYDQRYWDETHNIESSRVMMFTDKKLGLITVDYFDKKGIYKINEMFPYCSILSTEAIIKELEHHENI